MSTPNTKPNRRSFWIALFIIALPFFWFVPGAIYLHHVTQVENDGCVSNLKVQWNAIKVYTLTYKGKLPSSQNWIQQVREYLKYDAEFDDTMHCPTDLDRKHASSYAMNANLSGKKLSEIKNPHNVILLYETTSKASTPFGRGEDLPRVGKPEVGVGRHHTIGYRFNYYLMADGTVRAPQNLDEVKTYKWTP